VTKKFLEDGLPTTEDDKSFAPEMTVDRRFCIAKCSSDPHPGLPGAPPVPDALNALAESKPVSGTGKEEGAPSEDIEKEFPTAFSQEDDADEEDDPENISLDQDSKEDISQNCKKSGTIFNGVTGKKF